MFWPAGWREARHKWKEKTSKFRLLRSTWLRQLEYDGLHRSTHMRSKFFAFAHKGFSLQILEKCIDSAMWDPQRVPDLCDLRTATFGEERDNSENSIRSNRERWWVGALSKRPVLWMKATRLSQPGNTWNHSSLVFGDEADANQALEDVLGPTLGCIGQPVRSFSMSYHIAQPSQRRPAPHHAREQRCWIEPLASR